MEIYASKFQPHLSTLNTEDNTWHFRLTGVDVSFANGLRRTLLSDIPMVVFRTLTKGQNDCTIETNTSRYNNEVVKQRLSCIPIHVTSLQDFPLSQYVMELHVENTGDTVLHVTTGDFRVKHVPTGDYLSAERTAEIFPRHPLSHEFISFLYLRPRISDTIPGEAIHLTCGFGIGTAEEDGMFNAVCTCSYAFTEDKERQERELAKKQQQWKDDGKSPDEVAFESANWQLLEAKRLFLPNSFDFVLETVGVHSNGDLLMQACALLAERILRVRQQAEQGKLLIKPTIGTMAHAYDITLENEDYTVGKILEHLLHALYLERDKPQLVFCGFVKMHPHDTFSTIRVAFEKNRDDTFAAQCVQECCAVAEQVLQTLKSHASRMRSI